jgi:hypothetical protein
LPELAVINVYDANVSSYDVLPHVHRCAEPS